LHLIIIVSIGRRGGLSGTLQGQGPLLLSSPSCDCDRNLPKKEREPARLQLPRRKRNGTSTCSAGDGERFD